MGTYAGIFFFAALFAVIGTAAFRYLAIRLKIVDRVNSRSLHDEDKPRGGGLMIAIAVSGAQISMLMRLDHIPAEFLTWLLAGVVLAVVGLLDDITDLSERLRFYAQVLCAGVMTLSCWAGGALEIGLFIGIYILLFLFVIWCINAVNFMDGSDGLLTSQAFIVAVSFVYLAQTEIGDFGLVSLLALSGASAGFIVWNWQPAKIFLGDVGSYFIGFQLAAVICVSVTNLSLAFVLLIVLTPLLADASLTLFRRALAREKIFQPHRTHVYQLLIQQGRTHAQIALYLGAFSVFFYAPLALLARRNPSYAIAIFAFGCVVATSTWSAIYLKIASKQPQQ